MSEKKENMVDILIIGGGPTGMFAAFYAGMRNASTKIIETLPVLGGQIGVLYPEKKIYDIGGHAGITGADLVDQLTQQMNYFEHEICLNEKVLTIDKLSSQHFQIKTNKTTHHAKSVIITTGQGSFKPRRLPIEGLEKYEENNLHYHVKDLEAYKNQTVAICGGGDSAVDWALALEPIAKKVSLIHRRNKFRAHEASTKALKNSSVELLTPFVPKKLIGQDDTIQSIQLEKVKTKEPLTISIDHLIVSYGFASSNEEVKDWGIKTENHHILVNQKMETSVKGIYAAGDIISYEGKIKLIATGFGEAPTAVNHAVQYIDPSQYTQPIQSTQLDLDY